MTDSSTNGIQPTQDELDKTEAVRVPLIELGKAIMHDQPTTEAIAALGATAALTGQALGGITYEIPPLHLLTFCVLVLRNGFTVTGESACASPENFDAEVGRKIARQNAVSRIWPLMGYELRTKLAGL